MNEELKEILIQNISHILNRTGAYKQIQDELIAKGVDVDHDNPKWNEMEETIVNILTEEE